MFFYIKNYLAFKKKWLAWKLFLLPLNEGTPSHPSLLYLSFSFYFLECEEENTH
jgi:hypothetical protein